MDWKQILVVADDDYLVGISNKGIVKRAYKDKEEVNNTVPETLQIGEEQLELQLETETVRICYPLAESKCSCPSRSICRHVVLGILLAREQIEKQADKGEAGKGADIPEPEKASEEPVKEELRTYPLKPLLRAVGIKKVRTLMNRMLAGEAPDIQETSIVTVRLPDDDMVVKLVSPLVYATCTCHKKELCSHKAEAILWWQWKNGILSTDRLTAETEQIPEYNRQRIQEATGQCMEYVEELLLTGLCRSAAEVVNTLERLAIVAHNAELPRMESGLRTLSELYGRYLRRSTGFSLEEALRRMVRLYRELELLHKAEENSEINRLAGEFQAEYIPVGTLKLVGITREHFISKSGYEGDTVYFLEEDTGTWYTYSSARPTFYEGKKRNTFSQKAQAPWGLSVSQEEMVSLRIHLSEAKAESTGRLSSTQESRGEITGKSEWSRELLEKWYYTDWGKAFQEQIAVKEYGEEAPYKQESLVFLKPALQEKTLFRDTEQKLSMKLWDEKGRLIKIEIPYSQKEEQTIRYLERLQENENPCFLGRLYLKEGCLHLYPLDVFHKKELPWCFEADVVSAGLEKKYFSTQGAIQVVRQLLEETEELLKDLYQVGFDTVQDNLLERLAGLGEKAETDGLLQLSGRMKSFEKLLARRRHLIFDAAAKEERHIIKEYIQLCEYVRIGLSKVEYDMATEYYLNEEEK